MPLLLMARLPQILQNFQLGHTGIQSLVTLSMNALGGLARIFTTLQSKSGADPAVLFIYVVSFSCNFTLAAQVVAYRKKTKEVLDKKKK